MLRSRPQYFYFFNYYCIGESADGKEMKIAPSTLHQNMDMHSVACTLSCIKNGLDSCVLTEKNENVCEMMRFGAVMMMITLLE